MTSQPLSNKKSITVRDGPRFRFKAEVECTTRDDVCTLCQGRMETGQWRAYVQNRMVSKLKQIKSVGTNPDLAWLGWKSCIVWDHCRPEPLFNKDVRFNARKVEKITLRLKRNLGCNIWLSGKNLLTVLLMIRIRSTHTVNPHYQKCFAKCYLSTEITQMNIIQKNTRHFW